MVDKAYQISNNGLLVIDNIDGDITSGTQVTASTIDTGIEATLTQTITATDVAGNEATKDITVTVQAPAVGDSRVVTKKGKKGA